MPETDAERRARLPAAVYDLAMRLGVKPDERRDTVRLTQTGRMKRSLDSPSWMHFTATQTISTQACAFNWQAKFGPLGMVTVQDALECGKACLDIKAFGLIPITRAVPTPALVRGELMRYLAELPWAPTAILLNATLRWRQDAPDTLVVSAGTGETTSDVILSLDSSGRIAGAFAPDRPRSASAPHLPTPWRGRFSGYTLHASHWIPFAGEVAWEINGKPQLYWQGKLESWDIG